MPLHSWGVSHFWNDEAGWLTEISHSTSIIFIRNVLCNDTEWVWVVWVAFASDCTGGELAPCCSCLSLSFACGWPHVPGWAEKIFETHGMPKNPEKTNKLQTRCGTKCHKLWSSSSSAVWKDEVDGASVQSQAGWSNMTRMTSIWITRCLKNVSQADRLACSFLVLKDGEDIAAEADTTLGGSVTAKCSVDWLDWTHTVFRFRALLRPSLDEMHLTCAMPCERCRTDDHGERSVSSTRRVSKGDLKEFELSKWQRDLNVHNTAMHTQCYAAQRWLRSTNLGKHTARSMVHATAGGIFYKCHPNAEEFSDAIEGWVKDVMERSCHNQMELLSVIWLYDIHIYIYYNLVFSFIESGWSWTTHSKACCSDVARAEPVRSKFFQVERVSEGCSSKGLQHWMRPFVPVKGQSFEAHRACHIPVFSHWTMHSIQYFQYLQMRGVHIMSEAVKHVVQCDFLGQLWICGMTYDINHYNMCMYWCIYIYIIYICMHGILNYGELLTAALVCAYVWCFFQH